MRPPPSVPEGLRALLDETPQQLRRPSELSHLKKTVSSLYVNTQAWAAEEEETRALLSWVHDKVGLLQRAFHSLSDVLVEEVESLRTQADVQSAAVDEALRQASEVARLKHEISFLAQARAEHIDLTAELSRRRASEAARTAEVQRLSDELSALRREAASAREASEREARSERAQRAKLAQQVAGLEARLARQESTMPAQAAELQRVRGVIGALAAG